MDAHGLPTGLRPEPEQGRGRPPAHICLIHSSPARPPAEPEGDVHRTAHSVRARGCPERAEPGQEPRNSCHTCVTSQRSGPPRRRPDVGRPGSRTDAVGGRAPAGPPTPSALAPPPCSRPHRQHASDDPDEGEEPGYRECHTGEPRPGSVRLVDRHARSPQGVPGYGFLPMTRKERGVIYRIIWLARARDWQESGDTGTARRRLCRRWLRFDLPDMAFLP
jgi:hypothetical protein